MHLTMSIGHPYYDWPPMAPALDLKGQLANMNRGPCSTGGYKGNGSELGVKIPKLCLKFGMGVGQSLIIAKSPIEAN